MFNKKESIATNLTLPSITTNELPTLSSARLGTDPSEYFIGVPFATKFSTDQRKKKKPLIKLAGFVGKHEKQRAQQLDFTKSLYPPAKSHRASQPQLDSSHFISSITQERKQSNESISKLPRRLLLRDIASKRSDLRSLDGKHSTLTIHKSPDHNVRDKATSPQLDLALSHTSLGKNSSARYFYFQRPSMPVDNIFEAKSQVQSESKRKKSTFDTIGDHSLTNREKIEVMHLNEMKAWQGLVLDTRKDNRIDAKKHADEQPLDQTLSSFHFIDNDGQPGKSDANSGPIKKSIVVKFKNISMPDETFVNTTKPNEQSYKSKLFFSKLNNSNRLDLSDIMEEKAEVEDLLCADFDVIDSLPLLNKMDSVNQMVNLWLDTESPASPLPKKKVCKVMNNLFSLVDKSLNMVKIRKAQEKQYDNLKEERLDPSFISNFFVICDKIIQKEIEAEKKMIGDTANDALEEVCSAMNTLILKARPSLFLIPEEYLVNLVKGYLQTLFLLFFDMTMWDPELWIPRLSRIQYTTLTLPENLDSIFSIIRIINILIVESDFYYFFERFYIGVLSLIVRSETIHSQDLTIWKFILDLYSIHFIFMKSAYLNLFCRKSMESLRDVNPENILLRYIALIKIIPSAAMIDWSTVHPLHMGFIQLAKMYQNTSLYSLNRITHIHKAIIKQIFSLLFDFINKRYGNESEQRPVLELIGNWMKVLSYYINYSREYSKQDLLAGIHLFKSDFQELLFRIKKRRTIASNKDFSQHVFRLILDALEGLTQTIT